MVKSVYSVSHRGLSDWIVQRVSAVVVAVYTLLFLGYLICNPGLTYVEWHALFSSNVVKIATLLFVLALVMHAWVGIWTILTDYVKPFLLRFVLNVCVILALAATFLWGLLILWSV